MDAGNDQETLRWLPLTPLGGESETLTTSVRAAVRSRSAREERSRRARRLRAAALDADLAGRLRAARLAGLREDLERAERAHRDAQASLAELAEKDPAGAALVALGLEDPRFATQRALERLRAAGLVARLAKGAPTRMVGGTRERDVAGIQVFDQGFVVWREQDGAWWAGVATDRGPDVRCGPGSLDEAVAFVIEAESATPGR